MRLPILPFYLLILCFSTQANVQSNLTKEIIIGRIDHQPHQTTEFKFERTILADRAAMDL